MKISIRILALFAAMVVAVSCGDKTPGDDPENPDDPNPDPTPVLLVVEPASRDISFTAPATDESHSFAITTDEAIWDAVPSEDWCKVSKDGDNLTITALANAGGERAATVTVSAGSKTDDTYNEAVIDVSQEACKEPERPDVPENGIEIDGVAYEYNHDWIRYYWFGGNWKGLTAELELYSLDTDVRLDIMFIATDHDPNAISRRYEIVVTEEYYPVEEGTCIVMLEYTSDAIFDKLVSGTVDIEVSGESVSAAIIGETQSGKVVTAGYSGNPLIVDNSR